MRYRLDEPFFMAVSKPLLTEFGIHYRLESCDPISKLLIKSILSSNGSNQENVSLSQSTSFEWRRLTWRPFTCMYVRDKESLYKFEARRTQPNHFAKKRRKCGHLLRPRYYPLHATIKQKGQSRGPAEEASETHCFEPLSYFLPFILADLCNLILAERG